MEVIVGTERAFRGLFCSY